MGIIVDIIVGTHTYLEFATAQGFGKWLRKQKHKVFSVTNSMGFFFSKLKIVTIIMKIVHFCAKKLKNKAISSV